MNKLRGTIAWNVVRTKHCYCCGCGWDSTPSWCHNHDAEDNVLCTKCYDSLIRRPKKVRPSYSCYGCATTNTDKRKGWVLNHDWDNNALCSSCYERIIRYKNRCEQIAKEVTLKQEMVQCACGCGKTFPKYNQFGAEKKYFWSSHAQYDYRDKQLQKKVFVQCRCGCGQYLRHYLDNGTKIMYYKTGHAAREPGGHKVNPLESITEQTKHPDRRYRHIINILYGYLKNNGCSIANDICSSGGRVYFHPIDNNWKNIDIENYIVLCGSHLHLCKNRRWGPEELQAMSKTIVNRYKPGGPTGNKRRYLETVRDAYKEVKKTTRRDHL